MAHNHTTASPDEPSNEAVAKRLQELRDGAFSERSISAGDMRAIATELLGLLEEPEPSVPEDDEDIED